jgi:hypothetical protein
MMADRKKEILKDVSAVFPGKPWRLVYIRSYPGAYDQLAKYPRSSGHLEPAK